MCFAPERRALFRHLNFQKWSEHGVLCTFWLRNVLRATTACTFSTSQLPKVVRSWWALCILTSKCASRHNGVHFFISHLARWLRTRCFSEPTFRPSGATNQWKNTLFCDFPTFSRICIFFLLTLSLLWSSLFYSSLLSDPFHLCFSSVHIVGSLTSKLPSMNLYKRLDDHPLICAIYPNFDHGWLTVAPMDATSASAARWRSMFWSRRSKKASKIWHNMHQDHLFFFLQCLYTANPGQKAFGSFPEF